MSKRLLELVLLFLRLGLTAFGGPAAHIAMMEDEVVRKRGWLTREEFVDLLGAVNLIPGPNSTEMAIHVGLKRAGWPGLIVAGVSFILPAALLVAGIAWAYVRWGWLPRANAFLAGVRPVVLAIVVAAIVKLGRTAVRGWLTGLVAGAVLALTLYGVNELALLFGAGALACLARLGRRSSPSLFLPVVPLAPVATVAAPSLVAIFLFFAKVGAVLFGSGYVLLAFLRADLVEHWHWLSDRQLLDAITAGQITPGPVFTTATFVGWVLAGGRGAAVATIGIFLPGFVFVAASAPILARLRRSPTAGAFLDGVNAASLALMAAVTLQLAHAAVTSWFTAALAVVAAITLQLFPRLNSAWLVLAGALAGLLLGI